LRDVAAWFRNSLYSSLGLLWLTGCGWLVLHYFFQTQTDFGTAPHPLQLSLLLVHGVLALAAVFFFGWIAGSHIGEHWPRKVNRATGITLVTLIVVLALTGVGSYYLTSESLRSGTALIHQVAGVFAIAPALIHWFLNRKARTGRAA
jgi:heme A synthase